MSRILAQLDTRFDTVPVSSQPRAGSAGGTGRERIAQAGCISASRGLHRRAGLVEAAAHRFQPLWIGLASVQFRQLPPGAAWKTRRALRWALRSSWPWPILIEAAG